MSSASVEELELLSFFEVEPRRLDPSVPWPYNQFTYRVELLPYSVEFSIWPAHRDVSLSVSVGGDNLYAFSALSVADIRYQKDSDRETLEIVVSDRDSIWVRLRPSLLITQDASGGA